MKKKDKTKKEKNQKKPKDFIPSKFLDLIREMKLIDNKEINEKEIINNNNQYHSDNIPCKIPEEWNFDSEEEIYNEIFHEEINNYEFFIDPDNNELLKNLPLYFLDIYNNQLKWNRPSFYIPNYYLYEKIKDLYPKRNSFNMSNEIRNFYLQHLDEKKNGIQKENNEDEEFNQFLGKDEKLLKKKIYKELYPILEKEYKLYICKFSSKIEDDEEYLLRLEKEKEEGKNKKNKKNNKSKIEEKRTINYLTPSNLQFSTNIPFKNSFYSWITSIYQLILDLNLIDIQTKKSILYNIYPQENGIPIYNPKGKYLIKLYLMGKPRKIIIDDQIPFNKDNEFIFPKCDNIEELWPVILTKALMKLNMYKVKHPQYFKKEEFDDISLIYNLTGMYVTTFDINDPDIFNLLEKEFPLIQKEHKFYFGIYNKVNTRFMKSKNIYDSYQEKILELNKQNANYELNKPIIPLMQNIKINSSQKKKNKFKEFLEVPILSIKNQSNEDQLNDDKLNEIKTKFNRTSKKTMTIMNKNPIGNIRIMNKTEILIHDNIIDNYIYSLTDFFNSKNFNMKRTQILNIKDLIEENLLTKKPFKQIKPEERHEYLISRKKIKLRHIKEKKLRIEYLKTNGNPVQIFKVYSGCRKIPIIENYDEYSEKEILQGKKCIINNWKFPPIEYFNFKGKEVELKKKLYEFSKNDYLEICGENLISECEVENIIEPFNYNKDGVWLNMEKINKYFNKILLICDQPSFYQNKIYCDNTWNDYNKDIFELKEENKAFYISSEKIIDKTKEYSLIITFEPYIENFNQLKTKKEILTPYITLELFKTNPITLIRQKITLNYLYSCYFEEKLKGDCDYFIDIKGGYYPFGFVMELYSNGFTIQNMSPNVLFKNLLNYQEQIFTINFPVIEENKFWLLGRLYIEKNHEEKKEKKENENSLNNMTIENNISNLNNSELRFKLNIKYPIKSEIPFINLYLQKSSELKKRRIISFDEFVNINLEENIKYYIVISIKPEFSLNENSFELDIIYNNLNYNFQLLDDINPYYIEDICGEIKENGLIFSEYIYPSEEDVLSSLMINIRNNIKGKDELFENGEIRLNLELYKLFDEPSDDFNKDSIIYSYSDLGDLLCVWHFYNDFIITNLPLHFTKVIKKENENLEEKDKNKKEKKKNEEIILPYLLICYMEDRKTFQNINLSNLNWKITIFSNNLICFMKNNSKINHENKIKNEWEKNENGRSLKASDSRKHFLIFIKKRKGENLTLEEEEILNKERKRNIKENEIQDIDKKGNVTEIKGKKNVKRVSKLIEKNKSSENNNEENSYAFLSTLAINNKLGNKKVFSMRNILVKNKDYSNPKNSLIKHYLQSVQNNGIHYSNKIDNLPSIMDKETLEKKKEKILFSFEENEKNFMNDLLIKKINDQDRNNLFKNFAFSFSRHRLKKNRSCEDLLQQRAKINNIFIDKIEYHKKIQNILKNEKADFNQKINLYNEAKMKLNNDDKCLEDLFLNISLIKENLLIEEINKIKKGKNDKNKNKNNIRKIIEEIRLNNLKISEEIIQVASTIIKDKK